MMFCLEFRLAAGFFVLGKTRPQAGTPNRDSEQEDHQGPFKTHWSLDRTRSSPDLAREWQRYPDPDVMLAIPTKLHGPRMTRIERINADDPD